MEEQVNACRSTRVPEDVRGGGSSAGIWRRARRRAAPSGSRARACGATGSAPARCASSSSGGTGFIGPFQVRYALSRGHSVTLFNRGRSNPGMFPDVETLIGDRNGQLDALRGHTWDVVIDNSRSNPDWVRLAAEFLRDSVDRYFLRVLAVGVLGSEQRTDDLRRSDLHL